MAVLAEMSATELNYRLASPYGLRLRTGPFIFSIRSQLPEVVEGLRLLYGNFNLQESISSAFVDFHVAAERPSNFRRFLRPQVEFWFDDIRPFEPLPGDQGFPVLEWGMNWAISSHAHQFLIFHAAVLERQGRALMMPGPSGSGKSTLCATLAWHGWRLLSDELTLLDPCTGLIWPLARPISLKNSSIEIMRTWAPKARMTQTVKDTVKGAVAHLEAPPDAVRAMDRPARPGWVVFPRWRDNSASMLTPMSRARGFMAVQSNCFNYQLHGPRGFKALEGLISRSCCFEFQYSRLSQALEIFDTLPLPP